MLQIKKRGTTPLMHILNRSYLVNGILVNDTSTLNKPAPVIRIFEAADGNPIVATGMNKVTIPQVNAYMTYTSAGIEENHITFQQLIPGYLLTYIILIPCRTR